MSFVMLTIIGRVYAAKRITSLSQSSYTLVILVPKEISAHTVPLDCSNAVLIVNACQWVTMATAHRALTANLTSIAIWASARTSKKLTTSVSIEMSVEDRLLVSLIILAQLPECVLNT